VSAAKRTDAAAAVAGLFSRDSLTGGLARRSDAPPAHQHDSPVPAVADGDHAAPAPANGPADPRLRLGVELCEEQIAWLRSVSRPARTGAPRSLGAKFVAGGLLAAAVELLRGAGIDMYGISAGDERAMTARAHDALVHAALQRTRGHAPATDDTPEVTP